MLHSCHSSHGEPQSAAANVLTRQPGLSLCSVDCSSEENLNGTRAEALSLSLQQGVRIFLIELHYEGALAMNPGLHS